MCCRILSGMKEIEVQPITANDLARRTTLLDALHLLAMSWSRVAAATIQNCFKRSGFLKEDITKEHLEESVQPSDMSEDEFEEWMAIDEKLTVTTKLTEEDVCEAVASTFKSTEERDNEVEDAEGEILPMRTNT